MLASNVLPTIVLMALAYLIGSVPFSYLVARANGVDLQQVGSGNVGGANVWRSCGFGPFVIAATGDILKGVLPTLVALHVARLSPAQVMLVGVAAILGHTFSIFLRFTGGKAMATSTGVLLAAFPVVIPFGVIAWLIAFLLTRMSSVGSLTATAVELLLSAVLYARGQLPLAYAIFIWAAGVFIVYLHRENIQRLLAGTENRFGKLF
jgi:glycerol-3-phosphate acyltransferase PlsY